MSSLAKSLSIWQRLRESLENRGGPVTQDDSEQKIRLSAAVLMVEMARADAEHSADERQTLVELLIQRFNLTPEQAAELVQSAEKTADRSISLHEHLSALNERLDRSEKHSVLRMLWQVAYADRRLDRYEEHLLRKIADLLYVDHADFIRLKLEVLGEA